MPRHDPTHNITIRVTASFADRLINYAFEKMKAEHRTDFTLTEVVLELIEEGIKHHEQEHR